MKEKRKIHLKKKDWILIAVIVCVTAAYVFLHAYIGGAGANTVTIKVNGRIEGTYSLAEDQRIEINHGTNILEIRNGKADMVEADCPDKLCVNQKAVSLNHENIICLPNKVVVEVSSRQESELDGVAK